MVVRTLFALSALALSASAPANFSAFECAVNSFAAQLAASKLPAPAAAALRDALNVDSLCNSSALRATAEDAVAPHRAALAREAARHAAAREELRASLSRPGAVASFFVSTSGDDANPGTQTSPFATLTRAAAAARAVPGRAPGDVTVFVRAGTYYMGASGALVLSEADSNVAWAGGFPGDAPAPVVLSGAVRLGALAWSNYSNGGAAPGILVAPVSGLPPDTRAIAWEQAHPGQIGRAGPPPLVASLFVDGVRQQRARYPNANAQDGTGICFSARQRAGEGCAGYTGCVRGQTGSQPAPAGTRIDNVGPNRGNSPTWGCPQCGQYGSFGYSVYPPPPDHPVYNTPLPGLGWSNNSLFSFWGSPFDRPAGVLIDSTCSENGYHWRSVCVPQRKDSRFPSPTPKSLTSNPSGTSPLRDLHVTPNPSQQLLELRDGRRRAHVPRRALGRLELHGRQRDGRAALDGRSVSLPTVLAVGRRAAAQGNRGLA